MRDAALVGGKWVALTVQNMGQPVCDVAVHLILFALIEDFVASAGVEPVCKLKLTLAHVAGDKALNCRGLATDRIVGPRNDQDRKIARDAGFAFPAPEAVESLEH